MTTGSDTGQMAPMVDQVEGAFRGAPARGPGRWRLRFAPHDPIDAVGAPEVGGTGYAPVPKPSDPTLDRHAPKPGDGAALAAGRRPRATERAKMIAKGWAATAGRVKALARGRGPVHRLVRGLDKLKAIASWRALAHDVMRAARLPAAGRNRPEAAGTEPMGGGRGLRDPVRWPVRAVGPRIGSEAGIVPRR